MVRKKNQCIAQNDVIFVSLLYNIFYCIIVQVQNTAFISLLIDLYYIIIFIMSAKLKHCVYYPQRIKLHYASKTHKKMIQDISWKLLNNDANICKLVLEK